MILSVTFAKTVYNVIPAKFEAGTPPIMAAIVLGAAIDYLNEIGLDNIEAYEHELLEYATHQVSSIPGVRIIGTAAKKAAVLSFEIEGVHPHDVGTILNSEGIAIRTGHHCAQPVMDRFHVPATARASFAFYNTREEIDKLGRRYPKGAGDVHMSDMRQLYQEVILDHNRKPRNWGAVADAESPCRRPQPVVRRPHQAVDECTG